MNTIFKKIIAGDIPADKVYEDDNVLAFLDINPNRKGHTLVIPKKAVSDIFSLKEENAEALMQGIIKVAKAVKKGTRAKGVNIISNNGAEAGQIVGHLHFHIIPRFDKTEFPLLPREEYASDTEKSAVAEKIRKAVK